MTVAPVAGPVVEPVALFGHWICPYSVRVEFALAQLGYEYEVVDVPPTAVRPKGYVVPAEFLEHSPRHEIPMIREGGRYLADSLPILERLHAARGGCTPAQVEAARWVDRTVFRPMVGVYYGTDARGIAVASAALAAAFGSVAEVLGDRAWLVGDAPSIAEAAIVPVYVRLEPLRALGFTGEVPATVLAHAERCLDLPGGRVVAWNDEQQAEFVRRFTTYRTRRAASD
jgi:glutathione S-transferase